MARSDDLLASLRNVEAGVKPGTSTLYDAGQALNAYVQALASERGLTLPTPLPIASDYTKTLSRFGAGNVSFAAVEEARSIFVQQLLSASTRPTVNRLVQKRITAATKAQQASPAKDVLTFAVLTSPAWITLLLLRYEVI